MPNYRRRLLPILCNFCVREIPYIILDGNHKVYDGADVPDEMIVECFTCKNKRRREEANKR